MSPRLVPLLLPLLAAAPPPAAEPRPTVGYARATGAFKQVARPTLYQPLNLLDGLPLTAWCTPTADPLPEQLRFGFDRPVRLEALRITTGNDADGHTWSAFARASRVVLKSGKQARVLTLADQRGPQELVLQPPLAGTRFTLEILDQHPAEDPQEPVCLSDVIFVAGGAPLNGPWLARDLKYDAAQASLLGPWYAGFAGSPDRVLTFHVGGVFRYAYEPFDETVGRPSALLGRWAISGDTLTLTVAGKREVYALARAAADGSRSALVLEGSGPEELLGAWRATP